MLFDRMTLYKGTGIIPIRFPLCLHPSNKSGFVVTLFFGILTPCGANLKYSPFEYASILKTIVLHIT